MRWRGVEVVLWAAVIALPGGVLLAPLLVAVHRHRRRSAPISPSDATARTPRR